MKNRFEILPYFINHNESYCNIYIYKKHLHTLEVNVRYIYTFTGNITLPPGL